MAFRLREYVVLICSVALALGDPQATSTGGKLTGTIQQSARGRDFFAFLGIPYAKPPLGELRFKPPQEAEPWSGVRDATKEGAACIQLDMFQHMKFLGVEDCLFLNVYTPKLPSGSENPLMDVLFYIHGGGYMSGSGSSYWFGPKYFMDRNVVLVTINYRLGPLGFLSTGDEECPGNMGLKDQNLALQWVKNNIASFGGNPDSVTIFGESAGGASVHLHMLSPMSKGLFHKAISQSGTALNAWAFSPSYRRRGVELGIAFNCSLDSSKALLDCLRNQDATEITKTIHHMKKVGAEPACLFGPVVEKTADPFIADQPYRLLRRGKYAPVPWMTGVTKDDGALIAANYMESPPEMLEAINSNYPKNLPVILYIEDKALDLDLVTRRIKEYYVGDGELGEQNYLGTVNLFNDRYFYHGSYESVKLHVKENKAPVYFYVFSYRGRYSSTQFVANATRNYGTVHLDDLMYLFDSVLSPVFKDGDEEKRISDIMIDLWTNFARTGNPTPDKNHLIQWPRTTNVGHFVHLDINTDIKVSLSYPHDRMEFWESLHLLENDLLESH